MFRHQACFLAVILLGVAGFEATAADPALEDLLKQQGIRLTADQVTLEEEATLTAQIAEATKLRTSWVGARGSLATAQKNLQKMQLQILQGNEQKQALMNELMNIDDCPDSPTILNYKAQIQELDNLLLRLATNMESGPPAKQAQDARAKISKTHDELVAQVKTSRELADKLAEKYSQLAKDADIQSTLDQINKDSNQKTPYKMVESRAFQAAKSSLKSIETMITNMDRMDAKAGGFR